MPDPREFFGVTSGGYRALSVTAPEDLLHFARNSRSTFVFRGQSDCTWTLETRIRRKITRAPYRGSAIRSFERQIIDHFRERAHHFVEPSNYPAEEDCLEWLSLIQHYGGPTRLLDFTRSIFIATHFALEAQNETEHAAVWAVNLSALENNWLQFRDESDSEFAKHVPAGRSYRDQDGEPRFIYPNPEDRYVVRGAIYAGLSPKAVCPVEPRKKNRRVVQQQAIFLFPMDIGQPFHANLAQMYEPRLLIPESPDEIETEIVDAPLLTGFGEIADCAVMKLIIPKSSYFEFREVLRQMNVGADTLFPDLEGLTRSLEDFIPEI